MSHGSMSMELIPNPLNLPSKQIWSNTSAQSTRELRKLLPANDSLQNYIILCCSYLSIVGIRYSLRKTFQIYRFNCHNLFSPRYVLLKPVKNQQSFGPQAFSLYFRIIFIVCYDILRGKDGYTGQRVANPWAMCR